MELKVWVEGIQRIVCGVTDKTTCQDVVYALAHATGKTGRFTLIERWRNNERLLAPQEHPLKVLQKWGEYSQDVQFILQRSSLDAGNRGGGPLSPPLQRSKFAPGGSTGPQQPGQNNKARSVEPPPPAVWKPPPFTTGINGGVVNSVHGPTGQPGGPVRQVNGTNARLSPDSGRGSDKTGSDTSNSYASEKETTKQLNPAQTGSTSQTNPLFGAPPSHPAINGLPPSGYGVHRSASTSQMPFQQQSQQQQIYRSQYEPQQVHPGNYPVPWSESPYGFTKQTSAPSLRPQPAGVIPPAYRPPPLMNTSGPQPSQRNSSPADPPPYRAPPPPPSQGGARYRPGSPTSNQPQPVRPPHYSPPPTQRSLHLSRHPSRSSLTGSSSQSSRYQQQFQQLQVQQQQSGIQQQQQQQRQQQRPYYKQGPPPTDYNELMNLVSAQQATLQSQQSEIRQFESEVAYLESVGTPSSSNSSSNVGLPPPPSSVPKENLPPGNNSQLELVLNEVRRLEEAAMRNDDELRQMALEQQQHQRHLDQLMQMSPTECDDVEIRNEISLLKQRLAGTDQELQRTNHTLRRLGDEMRNMSIEKSRQREQELQLEMERLQSEIKAMQKAAEESANISQQLSKEVKDVEDQISQRKSEVEKLIKEMREANMESLAISPPEESKQFLDGPSKPGTARKMMGSPRQLESAVPTSKNPHGVWV